MKHKINKHMKKFLILLIAFFAIISSSLYSQITAAVSVDGSNNVVYPLDGQIFITNTNAVLRFSGTGSTLSVTNASTNGILRADDIIIRDYLEVTNYVLSRGTFTNIGNTTLGGTLTLTNIAILLSNASIGGTLTVTNTTALLNNASIGGTLTVTNTGTFNTNLNVNGNFTNTGNTTVGGTLTVTNTATFNTNVNVSGNLTNAGSIVINTANTLVAPTNQAARRDYVDSIPLFLTYDATAIANETNSVGTFLETMAPAVNYPNGKKARVFVHKNDYTVTISNSTNTFLTGLGTETLTTNTASITNFVDSFTTITNLNVLTSTAVNTNLNTTNTTKISLTNSIFTGTTTNTSTFMTGFNVNYSLTSAAAITNSVVTVTTNITRKLFEYTDNGSSWGTPIVTTNGLQ
jgi:hypothetical protein